LISYLLKIGMVALLGFVALSGLMTMRDTTLDIYRHPFAVSNAAMDFQVNALAIRKNMLELAMTTDQPRAAVLAQNIEDEGRAASRHLRLVREGFLGDVRQVDQTAALMAQWTGLRGTIARLVQHGDNDQTLHLATTEGNRLFAQIEQHTTYVVDYARHRAERYVDAADVAFAKQVTWLWSLVALVIMSIMLSSLWVIAKVSRLHEEVERQAHHDPLTGAANRRFFVELAQLELGRAQREGWSTSLVLIDLDRFKIINDEYGHHAGDLALKHFTEVAREVLRDSDVLGRIGGDEFVVLLPQTHTQEALRIAERLRRQLSSHPLILPSGTKIPQTLSVGIATASPARPNLEAVLRRADTALYWAKEDGRNNCKTADSDLFSDTGTFQADVPTRG